MSISMGMPSVGRFRSLGSGLFLSVTPGRISHDSTPQRRPPQSTMLIFAARLATSHSPVAAGEAGVAGCECAALPIVSQSKAAAKIVDDLPVLGFARFVTCEDTCIAKMGLSLHLKKWLKCCWANLLRRLFAFP